MSFPWYTTKTILLSVLIALIFFIQVFCGSQNESLTWDEPSYISAGYAYVTTRDFRLNSSHPPLMQELVALPLLFLDLHLPPANVEELSLQGNPVVEYGRRLIFESGNDPRLIAYWSRLPVMVLGSGLIVALFMWGSQLYGTQPALLAAIVAALCPNLIAHSKLATEDLGCTVFIFISVWLYWKCFEHWESRNYPWLCGIVTGLALLAKFTALLVIPLFLVLGGLQWYRNPKKYPLGRLAIILLVLCATAFFIVSAGYDFRPWLYLEGLKGIYSDMVQTPTSYLFGERQGTSWWYYLAAFAVKTPLPSLILIVLAAVVSWYDVRHREAALFLLVPATAFIAVSCFDQNNLGLRRILPALPFLYLFTAQVLAIKNRAFKWLRVVSIVLIVWLAAELVYIYPHHLSYFNLVAGGPERGPYMLVDSNIDWGQDLPALADWQKRHPEVKDLKLVYFGTSLPGAYGVRATGISPEEFDNPPPGTYAVSVTELVFAPWFRQRKPIGRAGYSIYIYQF